MNVEHRLKISGKMPQERRTIIHFMLVNNKINENIANTLKPFDITIQQFNVLRILRGQKGKPANLSTLNDRMVNKMSNTTRLVNKLMRKGYVDRIICTSNRRKIEINITGKGKLVLIKMDEVMSHIESKLLKHFSKDEQEQLNRLLNKF